MKSSSHVSHEKGTSKMKRKYHKSMHKYIHTLTSSRVQSMPSIHTKPFQHTYFSSRSFWPLAAALMGTTPIWMLVGQTPRIRKASPGRYGCSSIFEEFLDGYSSTVEDNFWNMQENIHRNRHSRKVRNGVLFGTSSTWDRQGTPNATALDISCTSYKFTRCKQSRPCQI